MIMGVLYVVLKKYKEKIKEFLVKQKDKFLYNGYLRSAYISYIEMCLSVGFQLKMLISQSSYLQKTQLYVAFGMGAYIVAIPLYMFFFLLKYRKELLK